MAGILCMLLLAGVQAAATQQVFKCIEQGQAVYQSMPCTGVVEKSWQIAPEVAAPASPPARAAPVPNKARPAVARAHNGSRQRSRQRAPVDACARARQGREAAYRKAGLKRDFALSSTWDNRVHEACR